MATAKVLIAMADYGHDPTETTVPYFVFKKAEFEVHFATETGKAPQCDARMLHGTTQKFLGATNSVVNCYNKMCKTAEFVHPLSWSSPDFSLDSYNLVFFPGGHDKGVRQIIDSPIIHKNLARYFPAARKPSKKAVAAICHGVMVLSETQDAEGKSIIRECTTTALPARFEQFAYWSTRAFLGDYYKTYGAETDDVEDWVRKRLDNPAKQYKNSLSMSPFVVQDEKYNYLSGRFPNDAELLGEKAVALVKSTL